MESRQVAALIEQADRCRLANNWQASIDLLKRALAIDPEHASAHASLALSLLGARRLHGAIIEADLALAFDPHDPYCHYAASAVRRGERKLDEAWQHCLVAMQDDDDDAEVRVLGATIKVLQGDRDAARTLLDEAIAIDPDHVDALTELARLELQASKLAEAQLRIDQALTAGPSDVDAHVVAGFIALARGDAGAAEHHARFALGQDAADRDALELFTAIKMRRNVVFGLWWRWSLLVGLRSDRSQLVISIGSFVAMRLLIILLGAFGYEDAEVILQRVWLAFCGYTWVAPAIFKWMLDRELGTVELDEEY